MNKDLLLQMLSTPSVSGRETTLGKTLYDYAGTFAHQVRTDEIGDVIAVLNPESPLRVLLSGHMDEIGLMVTAVTEDGFLKVTGRTKDEELPILQVGDQLTPIKITARQTFQKPPARYTEGSLVKKLEELGMGRPSTYASILSAIQTRG